MKNASKSLGVHDVLNKKYNNYCHSKCTRSTDSTHNPSCRRSKGIRDCVVLKSLQSSRKPGYRGGCSSGRSGGPVPTLGSEDSHLQTSKIRVGQWTGVPVTTTAVRCHHWSAKVLRKTDFRTTQSANFVYLALCPGDRSAFPLPRPAGGTLALASHVDRSAC